MEVGQNSISFKHATATGQVAAETADSANTNATDAKTAADSANTKATNAKTAADSANTKATDAKTTADNANTTAEGAKTAATDAGTKAGQAQTSADSASKAAGAAQATADTAKTTANNANTTATNAQNTANSAKTTATNAQATADKANTTAQKASDEVGNVSKTYFANDVYFQEDQPTDTAEGAIWFKVTENESYLNYHDDSNNGGTGTTTKTVTVQVSNEGTKVSATGNFTWNGQHPITRTPSMTATVRAYTYKGLTARYEGKIIKGGILWCFYTSYKGGVAYVPIKDIASGTRYGTDTNPGSDPASYHTETKTITIPGTGGNAVNDSQITLKVENVEDVKQYLQSEWTTIPFQKQIVGANISGASIDAPLISLGDGGVVWSSYSITQDPRFYKPIAAQGTVAMAQGELVVSGQTQYYDDESNAWASYDTSGEMIDGNDTNYTTTIINAGGIKNEMQDSARKNLVGRTYMDGLRITLGTNDTADIFKVTRYGLSHSVGITSPAIYGGNLYVDTGGNVVAGNFSGNQSDWTNSFLSGSMIFGGSGHRIITLDAKGVYFGASPSQAEPVHAARLQSYSLASIKTGIHAFDTADALQSVLDTEIYGWRHKANPEEPLQVGPVIDDNGGGYKLGPNILENDKQSINAQNMTGLLFGAVQELNKRLDKLEEK